MKIEGGQMDPVPTNVITGFLGVGKTSAILNLLAQKPPEERWAVLVNEFGEIGVDGSFLEGQTGADSGVFIREVPGGCMCCAAGLPMQIALNQLLARAKPKLDRLLIEPTGLGHPKEVLETLTGTHYQGVLSLEKTLTLVDARKLSDTRYTSHNTFNQQIAVADVVVGNKLDLYQTDDNTRLIEYVRALGRAEVEVTFSAEGKIPLSTLSGRSSFARESLEQHSHHSRTSQDLAADRPIPESGYLVARNAGEGFQSQGWRFSPERVFDYRKLYGWLCGVRAERLKAVVITNAGVFGYNLTADSILTEAELDDAAESRIEMIAHEIDETLGEQLLDCLQPR